VVDNGLFNINLLLVLFLLLSMVFGSNCLTRVIYDDTVLSNFSILYFSPLGCFLVDVLLIDGNSIGLMAGFKPFASFSFLCARYNYINSALCLLYSSIPNGILIYCDRFVDVCGFVPLKSSLFVSY
jgi:hypothetical protein